MKPADLDLSDHEPRLASALQPAGEPAFAPHPPPAARAAAPPSSDPDGAPALLPPAWFALALLAMLALHFAVPVAQWNLGMTRWWGLPFAGAGIALVLAGYRSFASRTTLHPFRPATCLVTTGVFARSRNPMYSGLVLSLLGAGIMLGSATPIVCIPAFALLLRWRFIAREERGLERQFGDAYRRYCGQVRRWL